MQESHIACLYELRELSAIWHCVHIYVKKMMLVDLLIECGIHYSEKYIVTIRSEDKSDKILVLFVE